MAQMAQALVNNDATLAGQRQLEAEYLRGEMSRAEEQMGRTTIRSDIDGIVTTPHVENLVGRKVAAGDPLIDVVKNGADHRRHRCAGERM